MNFKTLIAAFQETIKRWNTNQVSRLAGTLAYYAASSLLALLALVAVFGSILAGDGAVRREIITGLGWIMGQENADVIHNALRAASKDIRQSSPVSTFGIVLTLLYSSSRFFRRLKDALNLLWHVQPEPNGAVRDYVRNTLLSLTAAVIFGALLLLILLLNSVAFALVDILDRLLPRISYVGLWQAVGVVMLFAVMAGVFVLVYRFMPGIRLAWRNVLGGALVTSFLLTIGQFATALYIDLTNTGTVFGIVGSFIVILFWVYISAYIVLFGAVFTYSYAQRN